MNWVGFEDKLLRPLDGWGDNFGKKNYVKVITQWETCNLVRLMMIGIRDGEDRVRMRNAYKILVSKPKLGNLFQFGDNIKICIG